MDPKDIHRLDEAIAEIRDHLIPMLKSFYDACRKNGFTASESLELTKEMIPRAGKGQ